MNDIEAEDTNSGEKIKKAFPNEEAFIYKSLLKLFDINLCFR